MRDCNHNKIILPPNHNCFAICTKNLPKTLSKVLGKVETVAINRKGDFGYFYLNQQQLQQLQKGQPVTVTTTLNPFNNCNGVVEAWGKTTIVPSDLGF